MAILGWIADRKRLRIVAKEISPDMAILDLGCGDGWLVNALRNRGFNIVGIDPNLPDGPESPYLHRRSAYETGFDDDTFDCIICVETIEHLEPRAYAEIERILKSSGKLIVTTPKKKWNWLIEILSFLRLSHPLVTPHINLVDPDEIPLQLVRYNSSMLLGWWGIYRNRK
ncbi:MAG: class I SAM-dependent methyltransferase [Candidatus Bathyarchaeia archaeon]